MNKHVATCGDIGSKRSPVVVKSPQTPLFTNDGFWCYWGDYAIVEPHVYEMKGEFPSLFIPWRDPTCGGLLTGNRKTLECLLTAEARSSFGFGKPKANRLNNK